MKKILVATDASKNAQRALKTALLLAEKFEAEVELLYVVPEARNTMYGPVVDVPQELLEQEGDRNLDATLRGIETGAVKLTRKMVHGKPWRVIVEEAKNENIDLIVMGSHGYGAIVGSLMGSVSQNVLHTADCSVLIVK